jgi:hypothetical protein
MRAHPGNCSRYLPQVIMYRSPKSAIHWSVHATSGIAAGACFLLAALSAADLVPLALHPVAVAMLGGALMAPPMALFARAAVARRNATSIAHRPELDPIMLLPPPRLGKRIRPQRAGESAVTPE